MYKAERDDIERKLEHQLTELNNLQMALSDLERNHLGMKKTYEEEILRLRRQIESAGTALGPYKCLYAPTHALRASYAVSTLTARMLLPQA
eukprot:2222643-Rhodomonas_salina.2